MKPPRGLSAEEAALWARVAATVKPLNPPRARSGRGTARSAVEGTAAQPPLRDGPHHQPAAGLPPRDKLGEDLRKTPPPSQNRGLDSTWDRKLTRGAVSPDFTLDLHGHTLASAHHRLDHGLVQARALGARVVLLITGKPRPAEAADRGERRGAIRAKILDWLAAGPHASGIAAIRPAHRRHGGGGALYLILRKGPRD